ncbi:MAG: transposase [Planctomycetota bacterium]|nr:transposase [Planctomycetota bacterium]MDA1138639.1 transposase [Planctomycetota bacterium]
MARPRRYDLPHAFYHVLSRGNDRQLIFENDADRERFLDLLGRLTQRFGIQVWSYVLMGNHYHLILKNQDGKLSQAMQWFGTSYTSYFNWKWGRSGHLFQGRFKSFLVEGESYLRQLILYVHRNPLRAGRVERLSDYRWSSYLCLRIWTTVLALAGTRESLTCLRERPEGVSFSGAILQ